MFERHRIEKEPCQLCDTYVGLKKNLNLTNTWACERAHLCQGCDNGDKLCDTVAVMRGAGYKGKNLILPRSLGALKVETQVEQPQSELEATVETPIQHPTVQAKVETPAKTRPSSKSPSGTG